MTLLTMSVRRTMAVSTKRYQILFSIFAKLAAGFEMMDLKVF